MKVKDVMTEKPIVAKVPGTRKDILRVLVKHNITGVPVVKKRDGSLVGFITRQDFFAKPEEDQLALIMKKDFPTVSMDKDVKEAARLLIENNIYHLPVLDKDDDGKLVGIVTPADLLIVVENKKLKDCVESYVRTPCVPVYEGTPLSVAAHIIEICDIYALPVLNDEAKLTGIITDRDIFNLSVVDGSVAMSDLGLGDDEDEWSWQGLRNVMALYYEVSKIKLPRVPVKKIMIKKPVTVFEKTSISEAACIMRKNDFGQLPIRNSKDRLLGMIYELDLMVALIR